MKMKHITFSKQEVWSWLVGWLLVAAEENKSRTTNVEKVEVRQKVVKHSKGERCVVVFFLGGKILLSIYLVGKYQGLRVNKV